MTVSVDYSMMDHIQLKRMAFYGYHGALEEENRLGQRFFVDLDLYLSLEKAGQTDDLEATVNYADVYQQVQQVVEGHQVKLIERVAEKVAARCLSLYPIKAIRVKVEKPNPPIPGHYEAVSVVIFRSRAGS
ncbi:dihydroneopterin aldolase [Seinonella peptonophila]|uniref:dihydroneopterin aldolase n=1 Tax=Seinonella peptonophila TaxID=112248 RepID=UPI000AE24CD1